MKQWIKFVNMINDDLERIYSEFGERERRRKLPKRFVPKEGDVIVDGEFEETLRKE